MPSSISLQDIISHRLLLLFSFLLYTLPLVLADCECGYLSTINSTSSGSSNNDHVLFTDLIETDFTRLPNTTNLIQHPDWAPQAFNLTRQKARGDYGEMFAVENVQHGGGMGQDLQLVVRGVNELVGGMVGVAELDTRRLDLWWGSFRASMKVSAVGGTCAAFFWVSVLVLLVSRCV